MFSFGDILHIIGNFALATSIIAVSLIMIYRPEWFYDPRITKFLADVFRRWGLGVVERLRTLIHSRQRLLKVVGCLGFIPGIGIIVLTLIAVVLRLSNNGDADAKASSCSG